MSVNAQIFPGSEGKWDIPHIIRCDSNLQNAWIGTARLSPTAVLPANWVVWCPSPIVAFIWDIEFSTDTAIEYQFGSLSLINPNFAAGSVVHNGSNSGPNAVSQFQAEVKASVAIPIPHGGGFAAANSVTHILNKTWVSHNHDSGYYLKTTAVAANCWVSFYYCEQFAGP